VTRTRSHSHQNGNQPPHSAQSLGRVPAEICGKVDNPLDSGHVGVDRLHLEPPGCAFAGRPSFCVTLNRCLLCVTFNNIRPAPKPVHSLIHSWTSPDPASSTAHLIPPSFTRIHAKRRRRRPRVSGHPTATAYRQHNTNTRRRRTVWTDVAGP